MWCPLVNDISYTMVPINIHSFIHSFIHAHQIMVTYPLNDMFLCLGNDCSSVSELYNKNWALVDNNT